MRVLHVLDWYRPFGGAERLLFGVLELLEAAGHENVVVANDVHGQLKTGRRPEHFLKDLEPAFSAVSPTALLGGAPWTRRVSAALGEVIARHRPDVVHVHNLQNPFALRALTDALPTVRSIHDPRLYCFTDWRLLPDGSICPHPLGRACLVEGCLPLNPLALTSAIRQAPFRLRHLGEHSAVDVLIAESTAVRDCLLQNGFPREQTALLPNMTPSYGSWEDVRGFNASHRVPGSRTVLFVGRASSEKGTDVLLEAMALVPRPWKLVLVAGGEYMAKIRARVAALGLEALVETPGVLSYEETRARYAAADVVAFPSVWMESFGLVGLEAMANGKPVVAFRTGGVPEWLEDGSTGLLAELKDVRGLADRIARLLDDPAEALRLGKNGHARAARDFGGELYLRRLLDIYAAAIEKRRRHAPAES